MSAINSIFTVPIGFPNSIKSLQILKAKSVIAIIFLLQTLFTHAATYYLSPSGNDLNGKGTINSPWFTLNKAWTAVSAGDTIYLRGGTYEYSAQQTISNKSGSSGNYIHIFNYPGESPVINPTVGFTDMYGIRVDNCDYLHMKGLDISNYIQRSSTDFNWGIIAIDVNNCIFELLKVHNNGVGLTLRPSNGTVTNNLILNSDFYRNYDPLTNFSGNTPYGGADGLSIRVDDPNSTNTVRGCRIYRNGDDGFDGWGTSGYILFDNCWFFHNGYREDGVTTGGDGQGLKLGPLVTDPYTGYETELKRTVQNCVMFNNRTRGIGQNMTLAVMQFYNNTMYNNGTNGFALHEDNDIVIYMTNNILYDNASNSYFNDDVVLATNTFISNGNIPTATAVNNPAFTVTNDDFVSVDSTGVTGPRQPDGSLPVLNFLRLAETSDLIDAGTDVGIDYNGTAPDLGAFEYGGSVADKEAPVVTAFSIPESSNSLVILISSYTASDNKAVTGFKLTESATSPLAGDAGWAKGAPNSYTFATEGTHTLYAWVKDEAGNVSASMSDQVVINLPDLTKPVVTDFSTPESSTSLMVSISSFTASDNKAIEGYILTETTATPLPDAAGWTTIAPTSYTFATEGTKKLYAWVKDGAGNISSPASSSVIITLPDMSPVYSEYLFEETDGVEVLDSECSNDGIIVNSGLRVDGSAGGGLELSGSGYISLGQCFGENVQHAVSMSAWIKPDITSSGYQGIIMHGGPNTDTYALYIYSNFNTVGFSTTGTTSSWFTINNVDKLWDGNWHHLVAVYNGTEKIIYLDNEVIGVISAEGTIDSGYGYNLLVGAGRDETNPTLLYDGLLDEVRIYNYAISLTDVGELYHPVNRELNKIYTTEDITICEGEDYMGWTEPGQYERILQRKLVSASGADSIVTTNLYVNPTYFMTAEDAICEGETYPFGSQTLTETGEYTEVFQSIHGCDSTVVLTLTVHPDYYITEEITIVEGENYMGWTESGTYERNLVSSLGCDSTVVTNLSVFATAFTEEYVSICEGSLYQDWTTSGRYERTLQSVSGGDSIVVTHLTVNLVISIVEDAAICEGETYPFGSQMLSEPGEYTEVFQTIFGCDSTVLLTLTVHPDYYVTEDIAIVEGENYMGWTESGVYERNLVSSLGCDSTVVTNLSVLATAYTEENVSICEGSSYNGWTGSGRYERTLESVLGGDSIVVTNLTVSPNYYVTEDITIVEGEDYMGWTESGVYERNLVSSLGCDSVVFTHLSIEQVIIEQKSVHTINLVKGWNIISSYLMPSDSNMESVMRSLKNDGYLIKVEDESSNTYEQRNRNFPWVNNIGNFQETEGYRIQVGSDCALEIIGKQIELPLNIQLRKGSNIISFPVNGTVDAMQVIQPLIDTGVLDKVQDEKGNSIENWRNKGWINGIGNFEAGEGYIVQVSSDAILTMNESFTKSAQILAENPAPTYFKIDFEGNGIDHMNINIVELTNSGLKAGDEIAAFDNNVCVGVVKLTEQHFLQDAVSIPASASEEGLNNGYLEGNVITLKVWSSEKDEEITLSAEIVEGEMIYNKQASVFIALSSMSVSTTALPDFEVKIDVYPNPASDKVNIRFSAMPEFGSTISLFDMAGKQMISKDVEGEVTTIEVQNLQPGVYIIQVPVNGRILPHKIVKR